MIDLKGCCFLYFGFSILCNLSVTVTYISTKESIEYQLIALFMQRYAYI